MLWGWMTISDCVLILEANSSRGSITSRPLVHHVSRIDGMILRAHAQLDERWVASATVALARFGAAPITKGASRAGRCSSQAG